jgi:glycosyltransferase involved in cell wall biosynthesis
MNDYKLAFNWREYKKRYLSNNSEYILSFNICRHYLNIGLPNGYKSVNIEGSLFNYRLFNWVAYLKENNQIQPKTELNAFIDWCERSYYADKRVKNASSITSMKIHNNVNNINNNTNITNVNNSPSSTDLLFELHSNKDVSSKTLSIVQKSMSDSQLDKQPQRQQTTTSLFRNTNLQSSPNPHIHLQPEPNLFNNLSDVFSNIDKFMMSIAKFKNILFICGDFPGFGGSATLCEHMQPFFKSNKHNTHTLYYQYENITTTLSNTQTATFHTCTIKNVYDQIQKIQKTFAPDLIIFKSPLQLNFAKLPACPKYFLLGGIYSNTLSHPYYLLDSKHSVDMFINPDVINTIKKCDKTFSQCQHTKDILSQSYGLDTILFYSTFIPFYNKCVFIDPHFHSRPYHYGLIVSDFDRSIKNVYESLLFLKNKTKVVLIGKNSRKYKHISPNFECFDLMPPNKLVDFYKKIQYIRQDSFYESCSNVEVESRFYGCVYNTNLNRQNVCLLQQPQPQMQSKSVLNIRLPCSIATVERKDVNSFGYYTIPIDYRSINSEYMLEKGKSYIVGNVTQLYDDISLKFLFSRCVNNNIISYLVDTPIIKELVFFISPTTTKIMTLVDIVSSAKCIDEKIGYNSDLYEIGNIGSTNWVPNIFYLYGLAKIPQNLIGISHFYKEYCNYMLKTDLNTLDVKNVNPLRISLNKIIFIQCCSYFCGINNIPYVNLYLSDTINALSIPFHKSSVLLFSKLISGYGGVQKTSMQLIETLECMYNVVIISQPIKNLNISNENRFNVNRINNEIPQCMLSRHLSTSAIESYVNESNFHFILNNKCNEALLLNLSQSMSCICHNSMDPWNNTLITHSNKIDTIFTINQFHTNVLRLNNVKNPIQIYCNYAHETKPVAVNPRKEFFNRIAFVGRFSKDKNIQELIDGVNMFNNSKPSHPIELYIIGDGFLTFKNLTKQIIFTGYQTQTQLVETYKKTDYVISASITEGKPFSIIEALSYGIPCIHSNINGLSEIISHGTNGFLFDFANMIDYDKIKVNTNFDNINTIFNPNNKTNICNILQHAYSISPIQWNTMSENSVSGCGKLYLKLECMSKNLKYMNQLSAPKTFNLNVQPYVQKKLVFINFKPNNKLPYGGGNISVHYIVSYLVREYGNIQVTYDLCKNIDLYVIIDPFKDRRGEFKKYGLSDVISHRDSFATEFRGKIVIRVNDCDITRPLVCASKSREQAIISNFNNIDYFIFNSNFIKFYYMKIFQQNKITLNESKYSVIVNGCDQSIFMPSSVPKRIVDTIKIATHHWSNNMTKGYQTYYNLWKYTQGENALNIEFVFIGKNVPKMFEKVPIIGPMVSEEINETLNNCHMYITDSKNDACPNHVIEAISCGLPILYSDVPGGAKELCTMSEHKIGEKYVTENIESLLEKIVMIRDDYLTYAHNVTKSFSQFNICRSIDLYCTEFLKLTTNKTDETKHIHVPYKNASITITIDVDGAFFILNQLPTKLIKGSTIFAIHNDSIKSKLDAPHIIGIPKSATCTVTVCNFNSETKILKLTNDVSTPNILLCSDFNYLVGAFAALNSVLANTKYAHLAHFNFMVPLACCQTTFSNMLLDFKLKTGFQFSSTIVYIDHKIINPVFFESKCYNSGGHLLNLGNLSRLLIGEFMNYKKMLYLDSDSIVQYDVVEKLMNAQISKPIYASRADKMHTDTTKQVVIKMSSILNSNYDWTSIAGESIDGDQYAFMGAPFIADCSQWNTVYEKMIQIIKTHNKTPGGIYKLFTMSLQNIMFYGKTGDVNDVLQTLQDMGSTRKTWDTSQIVSKDVLDWSGMYKPWFSNGLYRNLWLPHDVMHLSTYYGDVNASSSKKHEIESFSLTKSVHKQSIPIHKKKMCELSVNREHLNESIFGIKKGSGPRQKEEQLNEVVFNSFQKYIQSFSKGVSGKPATENTNINQIIFVCDAAYLHSKMSRVRFWAIEYLSRCTSVNLTITGPGFRNFDSSKTLQQNVLDFGIDFNLVIWYKPLNENYNFDKLATKTTFPFKTCLRYNEMWDVPWTMSEIDDSHTDLIVCHHHNDYEKYKQIYQYTSKTFVYVPHFANDDIFKPLRPLDIENLVNKDIDILISGVTKKTHYPFKNRLLNILTSDKNAEKLKGINIHTFAHPGYKDLNNFNSPNQIAYNNIINRSKLCVACTSGYKYRLGKYVEIPMAGGVIVGDLPESDNEDDFSKFVIEVNMEMTDDEIIKVFTSTLKNPKLILEKQIKGYQWAINNHVPADYTRKLLDAPLCKSPIPVCPKIFIVSDEIRSDHPEFKNQQWICDVLKKEFCQRFPHHISRSPMRADIIWYLAPWNQRFNPARTPRDAWFDKLRRCNVVFTQHHIDPEKMKKGELESQFAFMNKYGNHFHTICNKTLVDMIPYFPKEHTSCKHLWVNSKTFFHISNTKKKADLRASFKFLSTDYLIGSFQKDTEGKTNEPKLSKGPDVFVNIVKDMHSKNKNVRVVLSGLRREYIMTELDKVGIPYYYFNMVSLETINELYNCLDLYIVSSRCEGGPRSVFECGLTQTPIISTRVGISPELMHNDALFDVNNWKSYKNAKPHTKELSASVSQLSSDAYLDYFLQYLVTRMGIAPP